MKKINIIKLRSSLISSSVEPESPPLGKSSITPVKQILKTVSKLSYTNIRVGLYCFLCSMDINF